MEYAGGARVAEMNARVDVERRLLDLALTRQDPALAVQRNQVGRGDLAPVKPVAVEKEPLAIGQHRAEVIADAFVKIEPYREPECGSEVHAHGALDSLRYSTIDLLFLSSHAAIIKRKGRREGALFLG